MKLISFTLFLCLILASFSQAIDKDKLVLYLPLDEGKGKTAKDFSEVGNDGKLEGDAEWLSGKYGKAIKVDGPPSSVVVKDHDSLDFEDELTIEAWVNIEELPDTYNSIITKTDTYMIHTTTEGKPGGTVGLEPLVWIGGAYGQWQTTASVPVPLKEWHHVAGVWDGKEIRTYIDGKLEGKCPRPGKMDVTTTDLFIGYDSRAGCNTRRSTQVIDEVIFWGRVLSESEIKETMKENFFSVEDADKLTTTWGRIKLN